MVKILCVFLLLTILTSHILAYIINLNVQSLIDVSSFIVKDIYKITFKNYGFEPVDKYLLEIQEDKPAVISFLNEKERKLKFECSNIDKNTIITVFLDKNITMNEIYNLKATITYTNKIIPGTKTRMFFEENSFLWKGNLLFFSPYRTEKSKIVFITNSKFNENLEFSVPYDSTVSEMYIYFFQNCDAYSAKSMYLRFTSKSPMLRIKFLARTIFVSHFGKISVKDEVIVYNAGPKLVGPYEVSKYPNHWWYTHLPSSADCIQFYDILGNSSKTEIINEKTHKTLKFAPRYPLLQGDWKTAYVLEYNVPVYEYLLTDQNYFYLHIRAMDHVLNDVEIEEVVVNILLPDGATVKDVEVPLGFSQRNPLKVCNSLCFSGRPAVILNGTSLVEEHIAPVTVRYEYCWYHLMLPPVFLISLVESLFFIIIMWKRLESYFVLRK